MEMPLYCTVSRRGSLLDAMCLLFLTLGVVLVHGFHPWAEDGGLYVAGVQLLLNPKLFPLDHAFVTAPMRFSVFAPVVATVVRSLHLPLAWALFLLYLFTAALMLYAALRVARLCFPKQATAQWTGVALLAAWWTLPVAGTSLLLMDPYPTARSFSAPLALLAVGEALRQPERGSSHQKSTSSLAQRFGPAIRCILLLALTAAFHPLMAVYAAGFVLLVFSSGIAAKARVPQRRATSSWSYVLFSMATLSAAALLQGHAAPANAAERAAVFSRYYWFLSQWQWFEWLGLAGPLLVFAALLRWPARSPQPQTRRQHNPAIHSLCIAAVGSGLLSVMMSALFAQEHHAGYAVARLQPLRAFVLPYVVLPVLLGGFVSNLAARRKAPAEVRNGLPTQRKTQPKRQRILWVGLGLLALTMFAVQRASFPASPHIEWPGRPNPNPWVQAFLWIRGHTAANTLVALDARYINTPGEDAQSFRALALRSALPDFSKDGGEAANFPSLAAAWQGGATATDQLSQESDTQRRLRLGGLGVQWLVLHAGAPTALACPYRNDTVKVCRLQSPH